MKTEVLFIVSNINLHDWKLDYHISVAQLSAVLKEKSYKTDVFLLKDLKEVKNLIQLIRVKKPRVIGFSIVTEVSLAPMIVAAKKIKKIFPNIFIAIGGIHCILNPKEIIINKCFDAVCIGEGEKAIVRLVTSLKQKKMNYKINNLWIRKNGEIIKNSMAPPIDINLLPDPDINLFYERESGFFTKHHFPKDRRKMGFFLLSRGCPFNCSYCSNEALRKRFGIGYYRILSPKKGIKQVLNAQKKYHFKRIMFNDDTFTLSKKWFYEFLELYEKKVKTPFMCNVKIGTFDESMVKKLKSAGCKRVNIGIESGDPEIREIILNRRMSNEEIKKGVSLFKKAGIIVGSFNMIALPTENSHKFYKTLALNAEMEIDDIILFIFYPYRATKLYDYCKSNRLLRKRNNGFVLKMDTILNLPDFPRKDILYYHRKYKFLIGLLMDFRNKTLIKKLYGKLLFKLYFIPPSSKCFKSSQYLINFSKNLKRYWTG